MDLGEQSRSDRDDGLGLLIAQKPFELFRHGVPKAPPTARFGGGYQLGCACRGLTVLDSSIARLAGWNTFTVRIATSATPSQTCHDGSTSTD